MNTQFFEANILFNPASTDCQLAALAVKASISPPNICTFNDTTESDKHRLHVIIGDVNENDSSRIINLLNSLASNPAKPQILVLNNNSDMVYPLNEWYAGQGADNLIGIVVGSSMSLFSLTFRVFEALLLRAIKGMVVIDPALTGEDRFLPHICKLFDDVQMRRFTLDNSYDYYCMMPEPYEITDKTTLKSILGTGMITGAHSVMAPTVQSNRKYREGRVQAAINEAYAMGDAAVQYVEGLSEVKKRHVYTSERLTLKVNNDLVFTQPTIGGGINYRFFLDEVEWTRLVNMLQAGSYDYDAFKCGAFGYYLEYTYHQPIPS